MFFGVLPVTDVGRLYNTLILMALYAEERAHLIAIYILNSEVLV